MKRTIAIILSLTLLLGMYLPAMAANTTEADGTAILRLIVPENWEMEIGDSRTVDTIMDATENRVLTWSVDPADIASVDEWGRVTALKEGDAVVTAQNSDGITDSVELSVVKESTKIADTGIKKVDFAGTAVAEGSNLQKIVTRFEKDSKDVPEKVTDTSNYAEAQTAETKDGAKWEITAYGVLRTDENAENKRDVEQRFMGDRYFYANDTTEGKVLAIFADGKNGIWTVMEEGYSHIEMLDIDGTEKARIMNEQTHEYVARRGMVSNAYLINGEWIPEESDNDGLWTSMYGGGELMRYAVMKNDPTATKEEIEDARKTATLSVEAVLLLTYISMREGTVDAYYRAQRNGSASDYETGKYYTNEALLVGGDYSQNVPYESPADGFNAMYDAYMKTGKRSYIQDYEESQNLALYNTEGWADPNTTEGDYAKRTKLLEGFWARTYSFKSEKEAGYSNYDGYAYWSHNGDGTATGISTKTYSDGTDFLLHNENYRGLEVNATGTVPEIGRAHV